MSRKITLKEIALRASVSVGTVDRVIHNRGDVSTETRKNIERILEEAHYQPNIYGRNLALNKSFNFVVLIPKHGRKDYWYDHIAGAKNSVEKLNSLGVQLKSVQYDQSNPEAFTHACKKVLSSKPDGILLAPIADDTSRNFIQECQELSIPVVLIDSNLPDENVLCFIGQNAKRSGGLAAKLLSYGIKKKGIFLIISITSTHDNTLIIKKRLKGFKSFLKKNNNHLIKEHHLVLNDANIHTELKEILTQSDRISGIFVPNSKSYLIVDVLNELHQKTRIIGYDLIEKNKKYLEENKIDFLIHQRPHDQGVKGIEALHNHVILKKSGPRKIEIPIEIITKENLSWGSNK